LIVDHFHVIRLANRMIDDVAAASNKPLSDTADAKPTRCTGPQTAAKACDALDNQGWSRLATALHAGDPDGEVTAAWQLKEITRDLYRAKTVQAAREVLELLYAWAPPATSTKCAALRASCGNRRPRLA
jgi:hypothetical protein